MMQGLLSRQIQQHSLTQREFLIGLSGGIDSVVLLHLFAHSPYRRLRAVHVHHGLSTNADSWLRFCTDLCRQWRIPLIAQHVKVSGTLGLEANARAARYQAIAEVIHPNEMLVTAHHLDDQAETFFLALKRGSGIQGLSAMPAVGHWQNMAVFRPLLTVSKREILQYAEMHHLDWVNDESNADNRFDRNFLRNQILPALNQRFTQFNRMVAQSAQQCAEQQSLIEELLAEALDKRMTVKNQLDIADFSHFSPLMQRQLIRLWLKRNQLMMPSQVQLQAMISELIFAKRDRQPEVRLGENVIKRYQHTLFLLPVEWRAQTTSVQITATEIIFGKKMGEWHRLPLPHSLQKAHLTIQFGVSGKVKQYGKPHREEMKKIWKAHNVPIWARASTPLVFWQDQLVAVLYS